MPRLKRHGLKPVIVYLQIFRTISFKNATFIYYSLLLNDYSLILKNDSEKHSKDNSVPVKEWR